jgi:hypothetical protein
MWACQAAPDVVHGGTVSTRDGSRTHQAVDHRVLTRQDGVPQLYGSAELQVVEAIQGIRSDAHIRGDALLKKRALDASTVPLRSGR